MRTKSSHISDSISILQENLTDIARVNEWAETMGYRNTKTFSRCFLRYYTVRPCKVMEFIRLKSIHQQLQLSNTSNFEIARKHSLPDEKALNKFVNYHLSCSPSELGLMSEDQFRRQVEKFGSKVR